MYIRRVISVLSAALSIGACVFITYISRDADQSSILFNLTFLAAMLLMLIAACVFGLGRLIQVCNGLKRATDLIRQASETEIILTEVAPSLFGNRFLDRCYHQYRAMEKDNPGTSCDIRSYINEEVIETYVHRGILEYIPDILTSLGILGTFVGLVMGLREFDPSGYEQMASSVSPLINGIKVAFITSIYGIALSLAWSFDLRSEFSNLTACTDAFLDTYYLHVRPPYEVDSLAKLLKHQKSQNEMTQDLTNLFVEQMTKSFEQVLTPAFTQMADSIDQIVDTFTQSQTDAMTQVCQAVIGEMRRELAEDFAGISHTVTELQAAQRNYTDFMDRSMARMQQTFLSLEDHLKQMEQYNTNTLDELTASQKEAYRINQEQKDTYQEYIRFMYQTIEKFSEIWERNNAMLQGYTDEIASLGPVQSTREMTDSLSNISEMLKEIQKKQAVAELTSDHSPSGQEQVEMLDKTLKKLDELTELVSRPLLFRRRKS